MTAPEKTPENPLCSKLLSQADVYDLLTYVKEPVEGKVAYIAGPMRGYKLHNFSQFFTAEILLKQAGFLVENPAAYDMAGGVDPANVEGEWPLSIEDMLRLDFKLIIDKCDCIVMLEGWRESVGANMELAIAHHIGLKVYALQMVHGKPMLGPMELDQPLVRFEG